MDLLEELEKAICLASQADRPRGEAAIAVFEKWLRERGHTWKCKDGLETNCEGGCWPCDVARQIMGLADELSALRKEARNGK